GQADKEHAWRPLAHPEDDAQCQYHYGSRHDKGPWARFDHVIVVVLGYSGHGQLSPLSEEEKVYERVISLMVASSWSSARSGSTKKTIGISAVSSGCSVCSVKQKHSILLK